MSAILLFFVLCDVHIARTKLPVLLFYKASRVPNVMLPFKYRQGRPFLQLKNPRHTLHILQCYQDDIGVWGEEAPVSK